MFRCSIFLTLFIIGSLNSYAQGTASSLFNELQDRVYQIRVIDKGSGDKSSIGSGFQLTADGYLATNYHVISDTIHEAEKYRLEYVSYKNKKGYAELIGIDVVHDLAILKIDPPSEEFFTLNTKPMSKGDRIYSMGNPHDLGMTIIEGNYNGLIDTSRYHKILFSGSLNAGMSGGPAFDHKGHVIGINVSKGPEQLSFLVPSVQLQRLFKDTIKKGKPEEFEKEIQDLILTDQETFYSGLLQEDWQMITLGEVQLPDKISDSMKCWGHTRDKEDLLYKAVHKHCESQDEIYIHMEHYTGSFRYDLEWITTEELNRFQFYQYLQKRYVHRDMNNAYNEDDVSNFECDTEFVEIADHSWRASTCVRAYINYDKLYDASLLLVSVDQNDKAVIIKTAATGISQTNIKLLFKKFMESIQWNP